MDYEYTINGSQYKISAELSVKEISIDLGDGKKVYQVENITDNTFILRNGTHNYKITAVKEDNKIYVITDNGIHICELPSAKDSDSFGGDTDAGGDKSKIKAPMPGKVVKILVEAGQEVEDKQTLVIVEAMKMENPLVAPFKATIKSINCEQDQLVDSETILVELEEIA